MIYVLEWRGALDRPSRGLVSHVRMFRSVPAMKAFLLSRRFRHLAREELRLAVRGAAAAGPIITTGHAILSWDPERTPLPMPLLGSRWEAELTVLGLPEQIGANVAFELDRGRRAGLLSGAQIRILLDLVARAFAGDPLTRRPRP